ncbi:MULTISPECIES: hypothetical protein [Novosphingopyxis]|uniref:hypothetical protein n=1 Tax=Novosphingopyxis TaxID=2709686 RepID=UPI000C605BBA|nr:MULTISPECIES: hypothetical protein [Novosphingopyxis]MAC12118.1 hypothetical protein [Sphingorhabdus sp.]MBH9536901.1 hypothetical protein [Novosphingopyxis sp. YJ-S2-01]|tara:strand:+ start:741 stop:923 length:183 start_codon:yes stop_codon:yes gene_type:complete
MAKNDDELVPEKRMKDMSVAPGEPDKDDGEAKNAPRDEENLEEGLEDSMDGSDPASSTQP